MAAYLNRQEGQLREPGGCLRASGVRPATARTVYCAEYVGRTVASPARQEDPRLGPGACSRLSDVGLATLRTECFAGYVELTGESPAQPEDPLTEQAENSIDLAEGLADLRKARSAGYVDPTGVCRIQHVGLLVGPPLYSGDSLVLLATPRGMCLIRSGEITAVYHRPQGNL
jgi:hypothetical protein